MNNSQWLVSGSLSGSNNGLALPRATSLSGAAYSPGGANTFSVEYMDRYSIQAFVTGSAITGTLTHQVSNNLAGWVNVSGTSINSANVAQEILYMVPQNAAMYARLQWSGSAAVSSSISLGIAGRGYTAMR